MTDRPNKRRERTKELKLAQELKLLQETSQNCIEQYNFEKLIQSGAICRGQENEQ